MSSGHCTWRIARSSGRWRTTCPQGRGGFSTSGRAPGQLLELLAPEVERAVGIDQSREMLALARDSLARADIEHAEIRHGDIYPLPFESGSFDAVLFHQVLHYLDDPAAALFEAARVMRTRGRLLIADFAPHELEFSLLQRFRPSPASASPTARCRAVGCPPPA